MVVVGMVPNVWRKSEGVGGRCVLSCCMGLLECVVGKSADELLDELFILCCSSLSCK